MSRNLFLIGTDTDVGKTYIAGLILKKLQESGLRAAYYKAAMSGNARTADGALIPGDALHVQQVSGIPQPLESMCPYVYERAVSPHLAARLEGHPVDMARVLEGYHALCRAYDCVTLEGSGGILCPIRQDEQEIWLPDIVRACGAGCLLVADAGLGTINAVGLTAFYLKANAIPLKGIVLNHFVPGDVMHEDNRNMCAAIAQCPVVACVKDGDASLDLSLDGLLSLYEPAKEAAL